VSLKLKEAFTKTAVHRETYKKQSGGRGKLGDIVFKLEPADKLMVKFLLDYNLLTL
jgi:elongation factor G